jgi:hypothetical protein
MKIDLSNKNLKRLDKNLLKNLIESIKFEQQNVSNRSYGEQVEESQQQEPSIDTIILDNNHLSKLEHLDKLVRLRSLSLANNHLIEIRSIARLINLQYVNLLNNSLTCLDGFKELKHLIWLNLSGNQIKSLDGLRQNSLIQYLDASENSISNLSDLSALTELKVLILYLHNL